MIEFLKGYSYGILYGLIPAILLLVFALSVYSLFESFEIIKCFLYLVLWGFEALVLWLCYLLMCAIETIEETNIEETN